MRGRGRGRARGTRGRRGTSARGRAKKNIKVIESDEEDVQADPTNEQPQEEEDEQQLPPPAQFDENFPPLKIDMEADISQLEAPTFTTINRGPPEPMLRLRWDHRVSLIGEKVLNPMIHCCDKCMKPILIYGRMIPCKHVFCLSCGRDEDKTCPRCMESVTRVEQTGLGTVFMCTHGGTRYGNNGCRRTYLSQRDLQAHINHRHSIGDDPATPKLSPSVLPPPPSRKIPPPSQSDPRNEQNPTIPAYRANQSRTNLITVPIQSDQPTPPSQTNPTHYHQSGVQGAATPDGVSTNPTGSYPSSSFTATAPPYGASNYYSHHYPPQPNLVTYTDQTQYWSTHPPPPLHNFYR